MTAYTAANDAEFSTARSSAVAGDTIELTGASYSGFNWSPSFASEVVVFGADPNNKPTITYAGSNNLDNAQNLTFRHVEFSKPWQSGDANQEQMLSIDSTTNLKFDTCRFVGGKVNGGTDSNGRAFQAIGGTGLTFIDCEFTSWTKALVAGGVSNLTVQGCEIHDIKSDGMTLDNITTAMIRGNYFHDFAVGVTAEHPDMIQFTIAASRLAGTTGVQILENILDAGIGRYGQLIFGGNGGQAVGGPGTALRRTNFTIRDNIMFGDHTNFLAIAYMDNSTIDHNTLILVDRSYPFTGSAEIDCGGGDGNTITNNICENVVTGTNATTSNNQIVNSASLLTYFDKLHWVSDGDTYNGLRIKSGTAVSTSGAGARTMQKADGWGGAGIEPHPAYLDGYSSGGSLQTLPVGSVAASVTVQ